MTTKIVTPPAALAVSMEDARNAARIDGNDSDAEIEIQIRALTDEAEHLTGRAIINRTYRLTLDAFPLTNAGGPDFIRLPSPPTISVTSVKYIDATGIEQAIDPANYIVDIASEPARITPLTGAVWPVTQCRIGSVNVVCVCGYGPDDKSTPAAFKGYILSKIREYFAPAGTPESPHLIRLLDQMMVYA